MISLAIEGGVASATPNRPPVNAINEEWLAALNGGLDEVERDALVKVLWIRSSERVFCAGADVAWMRSTVSHRLASGTMAMAARNAW